MLLQRDICQIGGGVVRSRREGVVPIAWETAGFYTKEKEKDPLTKVPHSAQILEAKRVLTFGCR